MCRGSVRLRWGEKLKDSVDWTGIGGARSLRCKFYCSCTDFEELQLIPEVENQITSSLHEALITRNPNLKRR